MATGNDPAGEEASLERAFDRAFAQSIMDRAWSELERRAHLFGAEARRRLDLLRLRFERGMPIRDIAALWQVSAASLHDAYAEARREFHVDGSAADVEAECRQLLEFLG